jgi:hypothetical protein
MEAILHRDHPLIFIEIHPHMIESIYPGGLQAAQELLRRAGYRFYNVDYSSPVAMGSMRGARLVCACNGLHERLPRGRIADWVRVHWGLRARELVKRVISRG